MTKPLIEIKPCINFIDLVEWAAPFLDVEDYHTLWTELSDERFHNDAYYRYWLEDDYGHGQDEPIDSLRNRFNKLIREEYTLTEDGYILLEVSW